ncbi:MAG: methyl-accepting chemotaxis protein [bacterium]
MKQVSLKWKLMYMGMAAILTVGVLTVGYGVIAFRAEIGRLYLREYTERIRNIEFEYEDLQNQITEEAGGTDADTSATTSPTPRVPAGSDEAQTSREAQSTANQEWGGSGSRREQLLQRLNERFIQGRSLEGQLFIFNGDRDVMLGIQDAPFSTEELLDEGFDSMNDREQGDFFLSLAGMRYWVVYSYYSEWDWYTGFVIPRAVRYESLAVFTRNVILATVAVTLVFLLAYLRFLSRTLKPFAAIPVAMQKFLDGDVNQHLEVRSTDEVGRMAAGFNDFVDGLREMLTVMRRAADENIRVERELSEQASDASRRMTSIRESTASLSSEMGGLDGHIDESSRGIQQIGEQVRSLNQAIDDQVSAVSQSTAAIEEMSASLDSVAGITETRRQGAEELSQRADEGGRQLKQLQESIQAVSASVDDISGFVGVIRNIASQTNLLSMNASIEAAHAGDAGRGFGVVADEIRKLASAAGESSQDITKVIKAVIDRIENVNRISEDTGSVFTSIVEEIQSVSRSLQEIASATRELSAGSNEIRSAMTMLSEVSSRVQEGSDASLTAAEQITRAMSTVMELSARMVSEISEIDEKTEHSVSDLEQITHTAQTLSGSVASLQATMKRFQLQEPT